MTPSSRFVRSVLKTADTAQVQMPWQRGKRRAAFIAKRTAAPLRRTA